MLKKDFGLLLLVQGMVHLAGQPGLVDEQLHHGATRYGVIGRGFFT